MKFRLLGTLIGLGLFSTGSLACTGADLRLQTPPGETAEAPIYFANKSSDKVTVQWVNYDGQLETFMELLPGEYYLQPSYENHLWVVSDGSNRCLGPYVTTEQLNTVVIR